MFIKVDVGCSFESRFLVGYTLGKVCGRLFVIKVGFYSLLVESSFLKAFHLKVGFFGSICT